MAEWFVGPVMEKLIDACSEYSKDQFRWQRGMEDDLQNLRDIHPQIQEVVSAYSQAQIEDRAVNNWYWQLRDAVDEADDVRDEFEYWKREKQLSENKTKRTAGLFESALEIGKRALKIDPNLKRLEVAVHKLYEISAEVSNFRHLLKNRKRKQQLDIHRNCEMGSTTKIYFVGRSDEMHFFLKWLRFSYQTQISDTVSYRNICLLSIVGDAGMGKTTFLQCAFEDDMMMNFDVMMWVSVSTNFKAKTVIVNILKSLKKQVSEEEPLEALQRTLESEVMSKRFLLVLDDIWEADETEWKNVLASLHYGNHGSKILITTQLDSVASMFAMIIGKTKETLTLKGLEEDECLCLFNIHAFAGVENPDDEFRSIAGKIVKKLSGCPLVAKVIGATLNSHVDKAYWKRVLRTNIGTAKRGQNDLLPILKLSYIYLPKFLKNCFSFCSIFPQNHEFDKDDLVRMWIALGFIQSPNIQEKILEDIGGRWLFHYEICCCKGK